MTGLPATLGFFDSGQGGLTIWSAVVRQFPGLRTIYLGDNARYPYGTKSAATVKRYTLEAVIALMERGADAIVVACGTASSVAVPGLTSFFAKPVLGIVDPMCELAAEAVDVLGLRSPAEPHQEAPNIALLATPYTVKSGRFAAALGALIGPAPVQFSATACPLLVPLVEEGFHDHPIAKEAVRHYLAELPNSTRIILLGCTHFPRLAKVIAEVAEELFGRPTCVFGSGSPVPKDAILLIDPAQALPRALAKRFDGAATGWGVGSYPAHAAAADSGSHLVFCTDSPEGFERTARRFCDDVLPPVRQMSLVL